MQLFRKKPPTPAGKVAEQADGHETKTQPVTKRNFRPMELTDTDKMVAATLAAAVIAIEKPKKPLEQVMTYERILNVMGRRNEVVKAKAAKG